ncbi:unnamed protein product [Caenorhabditis auriculariae]|uniref:Globin domain-containing protein n=1 Tax=Caenorhabditis auriculariae TaxID=2777116 RepID=A0A8S1HCG4_9PELO|nr:unnamed protein product [Caenorhabditis auriculariae]
MFRRKLWEWLVDKKTNTVRKWRSSIIRRNDSEDSSREQPSRRGKKSYSAGSLVAAAKPSYEKFFDEPQVRVVLENRRESLRNCASADTFPVLPPDLEAVEKKSTAKPPRSPKQIRFNIPEVQISFECEEPRRVSFDVIAPPPEIDWTPSTPPMPLQRMQTVPELPVGGCEPCPSVSNVSLSFDDEVSISPRRHSANEKARQNLIAQRRQSNVQLAQTMTGRRTSTTLIPLTCAQIHLIRSLWRQVYTSKGPTVIGTSIYHRLCFKCQVVKEQMKRVQLPPKFQNSDNFIKAHSKAVAELIDQVVENLDNLDSMVDELTRIGRVHARILRGELTGKLWNIVAETIIDCTLEWGDRRCRSETVRKGWALIVAFVVEKIKYGHHEQRKLMLATRQSVSSIDIPLHSLRL